MKFLLHVVKMTKIYVINNDEMIMVFYAESQNIIYDIKVNLTLRNIYIYTYTHLVNYYY